MFAALSFAPIGRWLSSLRRRVRGLLPDASSGRTGIAPVPAELLARSGLLATASHEIRTPLSGLIGMAELLATTKLAPDQRSYVDAILTSGKALADLVDGILDYARLETGRLDTIERPYALRPLIEGVVELLAPRAQSKGLEIAGFVGRGVPERLVGDPARLRQVLLNLAGNAAKFTEAGGLGVRADVEHGRLVLRVADTGPGIAEGRHEAIFRPFERGETPETAPPGTGLGLAISRHLVDAMGGTLRLESSGLGGSVFAVDLPLRPVAEERAEAVGPVAPALAGRTVMIVADSPFEAHFVAEHLEAAGARARRAGGVTAALEELTLGPPPDVLLVDAALGEETALALAAAARAAGVPRRLVLLSPFELGAPGGLLAAFDGWLVKPVRASSLVARVAGPAPRSDPAPAEPQRDFGAAPPDATALAGLRILVAEDDPVNGRLAELRLTRLGATVTWVTDGESAVAAMAAALAPGGTPFAAALLDLRMPGLNGFETAQRLRDLELTSGTTPMRIVALTASAQPHDSGAARAAGFDHVLTKPADPRDLAGALVRDPAVVAKDCPPQRSPFPANAQARAGTW